MKLISLLLALLITAPALAQRAHVWTNADLGKPLTPTRPTPTAAQLEALAAHQWVYVPSPEPDDWGTPTWTDDIDRSVAPRLLSTPRAPVTGSTLQRLDGTSVFDPPTVYGLPPYWGYIGQGQSWRGDGQRRVGVEPARPPRHAARATHDPRPAPPAAAGVPRSGPSAASAGHSPRRW